MSRADEALAAKITVADAIAYLRRVGLHTAAERMSLDRQIIVLRLGGCSEADAEQRQ